MARYELLERIGVGGMAEIFRGTAIAGSGFEKPVAIKRILPHLSEDLRFIELLIAEAKILSELHHRNIVQIFDVGLGDDGQYFLVMEFVDGTDLKGLYEQLFEGRRLPVEVALHICSELCEALEHAHLAKGADGKTLGLVHRDVSPSNVLLSKAGEVKLTDFGIAKRVEEVTGHGGVRGKYAYISPEQAMNKHVDARSDVYSVGILLYELACGQRLFSGLADFDALREVREGRVRPAAEHIADVAPKLAEIIMRALSKDPADRFQSAGEFGSALRGYRYSQETEIADPGSEIASLVMREGRAPETLDPEFDDSFSLDDRAGTVVRIDTAAEFSLTDLSGLHQLVSSFPEPRIGAAGADTRDFDDMQTSTIDAKGMRATMPQTPGLGESKTANVGRLSQSAIDDEETIASSPAHSDSMSENEPTSLHARSDLAFNDQLMPGVGAAAEEIFGSSKGRAAVAQPRSAQGGGRAGSVPLEPGADSVPLGPLPGAGADSVPFLGRGDTPTEKNVFHGQVMPPGGGTALPNHYPGYSGRAPAALEAETRLRKIHMGLLGGALAVLAFVIAGHFLGDSDSANSASLKADGGMAPDGGPALDGGLLPGGSNSDPALAADAAPKKPRTRKGRRGKRRRGKGGNKRKQR